MDALLESLCETVAAPPTLRPPASPVGVAAQPPPFELPLPAGSAAAAVASIRQGTPPLLAQSLPPLEAAAGGAGGGAAAGSGESATPDPEDQMLEDFVSAFRDTYRFGTNRPLLSKIFRGLVANRLCNKEWQEQASLAQLVRCLQCIRVLMRDEEFRILFAELGAMSHLADIFEATTKEYYEDDQASFVTDAIVELASIVKRVTADDTMRALVISTKAHHSLVRLLYANDAVVLQCCLIDLINLAMVPSLAQSIGQLDICEQLLRILMEYDEQFKGLSASLLNLLARNPDNRVQIRLFDGVAVILSFLGSRDVQLVETLLKLVATLAHDKEVCRQVRMHGGVPLILMLLNHNKWTAEQHAGLLTAVCSTIAALCLDDEVSRLIRNNNGVYLIGQLLLAKWRGPLNPPKANIQVQAFRALRFLFGVERNRKVFKRLFPPELFAQFIDVGHYVHDVRAYVPLVEALDAFGDSDLEQLADALGDINLVKGPAQRYVRDYAVQELIARGGYGAVFQVKKDNGETLYALKEIAMPAQETSEEELRSSSNAMVSEVRILSGLEHPNIVRYYESFMEDRNFYIVMELVDGASLLDHLSSIAEKGERLSQERLWQIFMQITMALKFLHKEKKVVHRDLTPSNIMLDSNGRAKLADFGLARQRVTDTSLMQSVVGTIQYSCPEIIQHQPYGEKADIWSLGCILYQMAMLQPPFAGSNMLTVARKIVEAEFEPVPEDLYEPLVATVVSRLMTSDPAERPDIMEVVQLISPLLLDEVLRLDASRYALLDELSLERDARQRQEIELTRSKDSLRRSMAPDGDSTLGSASGTGSGGMLGRSLSASGSVGRVRATTGSAVGTPPLRARIASPMISMSPRKLRLVNDPLIQLLGALHKILFISQLPPSLERDASRKTVEKYKRYLFSRAKANNLKAELKKLANGTRDIIDLDFGGEVPVRRASAPLLGGALPMDSPSAKPIGTRITYADLQGIIESVLSSTAYYATIAQPGSSRSESSLTRSISTGSLPPRAPLSSAGEQT